MKKLANYLWVEKNGEEYTLIMTPELQDDVGTVGFVEFTENKTVAKDDSLLELEGSKTVLDLTTPLAGEIVAINEKADYLLVDTAGRLQNKKNLMAELEKIQRTIKKLLPDQPTETLLVLDGSTGQNALLQAKDFDKTTKLTGLVLTKLDGSSKGGVVLAIRNEMNLPVKLVGLGEKAEDLADFDAANYAIGLFHGLV